VGLHAHSRPTTIDLSSREEPTLNAKAFAEDFKAK
jgi:hypothetical protein